MQLGGHREKLYCDTGSRLTIIPPEMYQEDMGELVAPKCPLLVWGSDKYLDTKCIFKTIIKTEGGARKETWVYVVVGKNPGPLLWDEDAEDLGGHHSASIQKGRNRTTSVTSAAQPGSVRRRSRSPEGTVVQHPGGW